MHFLKAKNGFKMIKKVFEGVDEEHKFSDWRPDHFADCIVKGEKCITDARHAARVVDILSRA